MDSRIDPSILDAAASFLHQAWPDAKPACGIILGSGWGGVVESLTGDEIAYADLPGMGSTGSLLMVAASLNGITLKSSISGACQSRQ